NEGRADGGGITDFYETVTISGSILRGNLVVGGLTEAGKADGGAINTFSAPQEGLIAQVIIRACTLSDNQAVSGDGGFLSEALGGAICSNFGGFVDASDSVFERNRTVGGNNMSVYLGSDGGAIANLAGSNLTLTRCTLRGNVAVGGNSDTQLVPSFGDVGNAGGGAIYSHQGSNTVVQDCTITNNQAIGGNFNIGSGAPIVAGGAV